ncbi:MAG TPA: DUF433 domain-containing protein [Stellaceae bacterium]|nr:DUF433 domain-containing protein [Stellaceae bacterium]
MIKRPPRTPAKTQSGGAVPLTISDLDRITFEPGKMGGRACIRGQRVTVGLVVALVAEGLAWDDILSDYPYLEREDIRQALAYAAWLAREEVVPA